MNMDKYRLQTLKSLLMSELDVAAGRMDKVVGHIPRDVIRYFLYRRNSKPAR